MDIKTDLIKKQSPDIWKWAGTEISALICSETLIDEFIECEKKKIENSGRELLDVHVFKWDNRVYRMVTIEFLTRPKLNDFN
ncbi:hypothetical protein [Weizmannia acidilactici]|uniref:hypothetical protein n=1 Tax=Weizmannia acidilactici TaxID=2607726 RepID=UPI00124C019E|nr:hypothetical protein [Weizmannia acidilactici]GER74830.1 hypothetical protein BpPP18_28970 [Weizmannia acidilactici]